MVFPGVLTPHIATALPIVGVVRDPLVAPPNSAERDPPGEISSSLSAVETQSKTPTLTIMLAEDNPADTALVREAIALYQLRAVLHVLSDGQKAFDFITNAEDDDLAPCPTLALLDLNLPMKSGGEILQRIRASPKIQGIPVIIITSSDSPKDRENSARLGANRYFRKPINYDEFLELGQLIQDLMDERNNTSDK